MSGTSCAKPTTAHSQARRVGLSLPPDDRKKREVLSATSATLSAIPSSLSRTVTLPHAMFWRRTISLSRRTLCSIAKPTAPLGSPAISQLQPHWFTRAPTEIGELNANVIAATEKTPKFMDTEGGAPAYRAARHTAFKHGDPEFIEDHTALSDARIEVAIMAECYRQKKSVPYGIINGAPWRIVNPTASSDAHVHGSTIQ